MLAANPFEVGSNSFAGNSLACVPEGMLSQGAARSGAVLTRGATGSKKPPTPKRATNKAAEGVKASRLRKPLCHSRRVPGCGSPGWPGRGDGCRGGGRGHGSIPDPLWLRVAGRLAAGSALTQTGFASLAVSLNEFLLSRLLFLASG